jgi:2-polyprenyl-3-methyl-5-hydroxy-6-metoxy-1,4-benzoquinol methylase
MTESRDYFSNHRLKLKFPWRLYHGPIVSALAAAVQDASGPQVLNVGSGPFFELESLPAAGHVFTVCDIDSRAIEIARELHGAKLARTDVLEPGSALPYPSESFDLVVAMDVIEHVANPLPWLSDLVRVTRRGGSLFLTTPNYASWSLNVIERTALEAVARVQGFTRKGIHPTPLNPTTMKGLLRGAGADSANVEVISLGWVVSARAWRATESGSVLS